MIAGGRPGDAARTLAAPSAAIRFVTPRALNEPVCWRSSAFEPEPGGERRAVEQRRAAHAARIVSAARTTSPRVTGSPLTRRS